MTNETIPQATILWCAVQPVDEDGDHAPPRAGRVIGWVHQADTDVWLPLVTSPPYAKVLPRGATAVYATTEAAALSSVSPVMPWWATYPVGPCSPVERAQHYVCEVLNVVAGADGVTVSELATVLGELPEHERPSRSYLLAALGNLAEDGVATVERGRVRPA